MALKAYLTLLRFRETVPDTALLNVQEAMLVCRSLLDVRSYCEYTQERCCRFRAGNVQFVMSPRKSCFVTNECVDRRLTNNSFEIMLYLLLPACPMSHTSLIIHYRQR